MKHNLGNNKYRKVLLAVQRTKQLHNGARQRVTLEGAKDTRIALTEIERGLIGFHFAPDKKGKK